MTHPEPAGLTPDELRQIRKQIADNRCLHCGGAHARACPRVKTMSYHPNGALAGVEFWPDGKWSTDHVLFLDEYPDPDDEQGA